MPLKKFSDRVKTRTKIVFSIITLLLLIEIINILTGRSLGQFGIYPRHSGSLTGIFTAPFIHGSLVHFLSNAIPLAIFCFLLLIHGTRRFILVSLWVMVAGGSLVWLFGRNAMHIGASGVFYGYFAYLVTAGLLSRQFKLLLISLFVMLGYGGMVWGVLPTRPYISWESHLFGALAGMLCAVFYIRKRNISRH